MTDFNLLRAKSDGQLFLRIYSEHSHYVVALDESEIAQLRDRLNRPPETVDR